MASVAVGMRLALGAEGLEAEPPDHAVPEYGQAPSSGGRSAGRRSQEDTPPASNTNGTLSGARRGADEPTAPRLAPAPQPSAASERSGGGVLRVEILEPGLQNALAHWVNGAARDEPWWYKVVDSGVILGGALAILSGVATAWANSRYQSEQARTLARVNAEVARENRLDEFRLEIARAAMREDARVLQRFHAPMLAFSQQRDGIVKKVTQHVWRLWEKHDGSWPDQREYKLMTSAEATGGALDPVLGNQRLLYIRVGDDWKRFRMLDFMPWLKREESCHALLRQVMTIGKLQAELIHAYGGLAAGGDEPSPLFGDYLAHFAILQATYDQPPDRPHDPESQDSGYFPAGLDLEIKRGYERAMERIEEQSSRWRIS